MTSQPFHFILLFDHVLVRLMSQSANASGPHFPRALARVPTVFFLDSLHRPHYARHTVTLQFSDACSSSPLRSTRCRCVRPKSALGLQSLRNYVTLEPIPTHPTCSCLSLTHRQPTKPSSAVEPDFATTSTLPHAHLYNFL